VVIDADVMQRSIFDEQHDQIAIGAARAEMQQLQRFVADLERLPRLKNVVRQQSSCLTSPVPRVEGVQVKEGLNS
jgi:hypothetical protein